MNQPARNVSPARRVLLGAVVAITLLLGIELACRVTLPSLRTASVDPGMIAAQNVPGFRSDPDLYWYWAVMPSGELNQWGFRRTKPMTVEPPPGVRRVVTLGDSQTWGAFVSADQTYSAFAEADLGDGWEVLNAGISGYRSLNVYRLLQLHILQFSPEIVLVDVAPEDCVRDDGPLVGTRRAPPSQWLKSLLWNTGLYRAVEQIVHAGDPERGRLQPDGRRFAGNHDLILSWGRENGVDVVFMVPPFRDDRTGKLTCVPPDAFPDGAPRVPACETITASGLDPKDLFFDNNHLTVSGNRLVGGAVADVLRALPQSPR